MHEKVLRTTGPKLFMAAMDLYDGRQAAREKHEATSRVMHRGEPTGTVRVMTEDYNGVRWLSLSLWSSLWLWLWLWLCRALVVAVAVAVSSVGGIGHCLFAPRPLYVESLLLSGEHSRLASVLGRT